MGVSTDGILFWGITYKSLEEAVAEEADAAEAAKAAYNTYWSSNGFLSEQAKKDCIIDAHCSGDYPIYYVAIRPSRIVAHRGYHKEIKSLEVGSDWFENLKGFCELLKLSWRDPKWYLCSYWG